MNASPLLFAMKEGGIRNKRTLRLRQRFARLDSSGSLNEDAPCTAAAPLETSTQSTSSLPEPQSPARSSSSDDRRQKSLSSLDKVLQRSEPGQRRLRLEGFEDNALFEESGCNTVVSEHSDCTSKRKEKKKKTRVYAQLDIPTAVGEDEAGLGVTYVTEKRVRLKSFAVKDSGARPSPALANLNPSPNNIANSAA